MYHIFGKILILLHHIGDIQIIIFYALPKSIVICLLCTSLAHYKEIFQ